jgi:hypothetical protein
MGSTLIAMIAAGRGAKPYLRKVLSTDENLFEVPINLEQSINYYSGMLGDSDEWFSLPSFTTKKYCLEFLKRNFSSVDYDTIEPSNFGKIKFLCNYQEKVFCFQRVTASRQLRQKRIYFGEQCKYEKSSEAIIINDFPDAIYNSERDILYFRKLRDISAIFDGIDELYREATESEVSNFLASSFIELADGFTSFDVKTNNRKKIAMALDTLTHFTDSEQTTVLDYIRDYCPELVAPSDKLTISSEDSLKKLLYGIEQRYYTTPIGEEKRLANSIIPLA